MITKKDSQAQIRPACETASKRPSLKVNALSNWAALGVNIAVGFYVTPFIIRNLGKDAYGIWSLVATFIGYYNLLNLGVGSAITRYIARYSGQGEREKLNETASTALAMFTGTGGMVVLVSFLGAESISRFVQDVPVSQQEHFVRLIRILGLATGIGFPASVFIALVTAREHYIGVNLGNILRILIRTAFIVILVKMGYGLTGAGFACLISASVDVAVSVLLYRRFAKDICFRWRYAKGSCLKMLLIYGLPTLVISFSDLLRFQLDGMVIGRILGVGAVGVYGVAGTIQRYVMQATIAAMGVLNPRFSRMAGDSNLGALRELFLKSLTASSILSFGLLFVSLAAMKPFVALWAGDEFEGAVGVYWVLALAMNLDLAQNPGIGILYAMGKHYYYAGITVVEGIIKVILSIALAQKYGILGVAAGTAIPMVLIRIFFQPLYVCRVLDLSWKRYLRSFVNSGASFVLFLGLWYILCKERYFRFESYGGLAIYCSITGIIYFGIQACIHRELRLNILQLLGYKTKEKRLYA